MQWPKALYLIPLLAVLIAGPAQAGTLTVQSSDGVEHRFRVDVADTPETRARGLMHRKYMAQDVGMLFVFDKPLWARFWMKNTFIPLDIIYIDTQGKIVNIIENAVPHSEEPRLSEAMVQYVLEINGGLSHKLGIMPGARVLHERITPNGQ